MKIEFAYLTRIGVSQKALDFYSNTDPFCIVKNDDGSFDALGCISFHAENDTDLKDTLEQIANDI